MELSKETMKKLMALIAFTVLLLVGAQHLDVVLGALGFLWGIAFPLVLGQIDHYPQRVAALCGNQHMGFTPF